MRNVTAILVIFAVLATGAMAEEKAIDTQDAAASSLSRGTLAGTLDENSPTYDRVYGSAPASTECDAYLSDSGNDGMYLALFCVKATTTDPIEVIVDAAGTIIDDTVMTLYCDPFDAAVPGDNIVFFDDDGGEGFLSAFTLNDNVVLVPGDSYFLVLSTYFPDMMGDFVIQTSDNLVECGTVANEDVSWDTLKALFK